MLSSSTSFAGSAPLAYTPIPVPMNWSVQTGSSSKNGSHASFHWPSSRILSQAGVGEATGRVADCVLADLVSSSRRGAPRLQLWIDRSEAILRTIRISSREAPASSAARMWRRVPSGLRLVQAAFNAIPTTSINLRGKTPEVHGPVVILKQLSAQSGSHARSCANGEPQGPVSLGPLAVAGSSPGALPISLTYLFGLLDPV